MLAFFACNLKRADPALIPEGDVISNRQLISSLRGIKVFTSDDTYYKIKYDHLVDLVAYNKKVLELREISNYHKRFDCEDFTSVFMAETKIWFSKTEIYPEETDGIAVGEIWYLVDGDPEKGHSAAIALTENGFVMIDTIHCDLYYLTDAEWDSVIQIRF